MTEVYKKLAKHLSNTPGGFPKTESGVELRILKNLFTEQEAEIATFLIMMPEQIEQIAERAGKDPKKLEPTLKIMAEKGLIIHSNQHGINYYMTAQFVVGIWEFQVNRLNKELIKDFNEYVPYLMKEQTKTKTQQLRVIPVSKSINAQMTIMDYDEAEKIIKAQSKVLIAPCICRTEHTLIGKGCDKLMEACFVFGGGAYAYEKRKIGRMISHDEAIKILHKGIEQGLVLQPGNAKKPFNICMCCDCCCQILKTIKKSNAPSKIVHSSYFAEINEDNCTACETCKDICPMDAITIEDTSIIDKNRCIGCGLCVTVCEFESIKLVEKDDKQKWIPPENTIETYMNIAKEKGLI
ncbi:MAG: 4Fe-4S ferredoxin [Desulfobacteraceae bacterium 4572_130]|nr:MAG: 4Fe-4S ferredoxin [Desulfobacteraceae bacterium 4572_130]